MELRVDVAVDGPRFEGGIEAARLAAADHFAHHAAIVADAQFAFGDAQRGPADQCVVRPVPEKDARPIRFQQPRGRLGHLR